MDVFLFSPALISLLAVIVLTLGCSQVTPTPTLTPTPTATSTPPPDLAVVDPDQWQEARMFVSGDGFSLMLPPGWELRRGHALEDASVGDIAGDGVRLTYYYGPHTDTSLVWAEDPEHVLSQEEINGRKVQLARPKYGTEGTTGMSAASGDDCRPRGSGRVKLEISGRHLTPEQQDIALKMFRTIKIVFQNEIKPDAPPPAATPTPTPTNLISRERAIEAALKGLSRGSPEATGVQNPRNPIAYLMPFTEYEEKYTSGHSCMYRDKLVWIVQFEGESRDAGAFVDPNNPRVFRYANVLLNAETGDLLGGGRSFEPELQ